MNISVSDLWIIECLPFLVLSVTHALSFGCDLTDYAQKNRSEWLQRGQEVVAEMVENFNQKEWPDAPACPFVEA